MTSKQIDSIADTSLGHDSLIVVSSSLWLFFSVAYNESEDAIQLVCWKTEDGGDTWNDYLVKQDDSISGHPIGSDVDSEGNIWVAYRSSSGNCLAMSDDYGETWTEYGGSSSRYKPTVKVISDYACTLFTASGSNPALYSHTLFLSTHTWNGDPAQISAHIYPDPYYTYSYDLRKNSSGHLYCLYLSASDYSLSLGKCTNAGDGDTWNSQDLGVDAWDFAIDVVGDNILVAYVDGSGDAYVKVSANGGTDWSTYGPIKSGVQNISCCIDPSTVSNMWITCVDSSDPNQYLLSSTNSGEDWSDTTVATDIDNYYENAMLALSGNTYFTKAYYDGDSTYAYYVLAEGASAGEIFYPVHSEISDVRLPGNLFILTSISVQKFDMGVGIADPSATWDFSADGLEINDISRAGKSILAIDAAKTKMVFLDKDLVLDEEVSGTFVDSVFGSDIPYRWDSYNRQHVFAIGSDHGSTFTVYKMTKSESGTWSYSRKAIAEYSASNKDITANTSYYAVAIYGLHESVNKYKVILYDSLTDAKLGELIVDSVLVSVQSTEDRLIVVTTDTCYMYSVQKLPSLTLTLIATITPPDSGDVSKYYKSSDLDLSTQQVFLAVDNSNFKQYSSGGSLLSEMVIDTIGNNNGAMLVFLDYFNPYPTGRSLVESKPNVDVLSTRSKVTNLKSEYENELVWSKSNVDIAGVLSKISLGPQPFPTVDANIMIRRTRQNYRGLEMFQMAAGKFTKIAEHLLPEEGLSQKPYGGMCMASDSRVYLADRWLKGSDFGLGHRSESLNVGPNLSRVYCKGDSVYVNGHVLSEPSTDLLTSFFGNTVPVIVDKDTLQITDYMYFKPYGNEMLQASMRSFVPLMQDQFAKCSVTMDAPMMRSSVMVSSFSVKSKVSMIPDDYLVKSSVPFLRTVFPARKSSSDWSYSSISMDHLGVMSKLIITPDDDHDNVRSKITDLRTWDQYYASSSVELVDTVGYLFADFVEFSWQYYIDYCTQLFVKPCQDGDLFLAWIRTPHATFESTETVWANFLAIMDSDGHVLNQVSFQTTGTNVPYIKIQTPKDHELSDDTGAYCQLFCDSTILDSLELVSDSVLEGYFMSGHVINKTTDSEYEHEVLCKASFGLGLCHHGTKQSSDYNYMFYRSDFAPGLVIGLNGDKILINSTEVLSWGPCGSTGYSPLYTPGNFMGGFRMLGSGLDLIESFAYDGITDWDRYGNVDDEPYIPVKNMFFRNISLPLYVLSSVDISTIYISSLVLSSARLTNAACSLIKGLVPLGIYVNSELMRAKPPVYSPSHMSPYQIFGRVNLLQWPSDSNVISTSVDLKSISVDLELIGGNILDRTAESDEPPISPEVLCQTKPDEQQYEWYEVQIGDVTKINYQKFMTDYGYAWYHAEYTTLQIDPSWGGTSFWFNYSWHSQKHYISHYDINGVLISKILIADYLDPTETGQVMRPTCAFMKDKFYLAFAKGDVDFYIRDDAFTGPFQGVADKDDSYVVALDLDGNYVNSLGLYKSINIMFGLEDDSLVDYGDYDANKHWNLRIITIHDSNDFGTNNFIMVNDGTNLFLSLYRWAADMTGIDQRVFMIDEFLSVAEQIPFETGGAASELWSEVQSLVAANGRTLLFFARHCAVHMFSYSGAHINSWIESELLDSQDCNNRFKDFFVDRQGNYLVMTQTNEYYWGDGDYTLTVRSGDFGAQLMKWTWQIGTGVDLDFAHYRVMYVSRSVRAPMDHVRDWEPAPILVGPSAFLSTYLDKEQLY